MAEVTPETLSSAPLPELLTVTEVMAMLRVSRRQLHRLTCSGLPSVQLGPSTIRFPRDGVEEFIRRRTRVTAETQTTVPECHQL